MSSLGFRQAHVLALSLALAAMMSFLIWGGTAQAESGSGSDGSGSSDSAMDNSGSGSSGDAVDNSGSGGNNVQLPCDGDNSGSYRDVECVNGQPAPTEDGIGDFNEHRDHFCPNPDVAACNDPNVIVEPDPDVDPVNNPPANNVNNPPANNVNNPLDNRDNDADGVIDEADEIEVRLVATDGVDNDADGAIDEVDGSEQVAVAQTPASAAPSGTQASVASSGAPATGDTSGPAAVTVLPQTGGPALLAPITGLFLVVSGALGLLARRLT